VSAEATYSYSDAGGGTHRTLVSLIDPGIRVLDVGCASGYLGAALHHEKACRVWGIDVDPASVEAARARGYEDVVQADLDAPDLPADLAAGLGLPDSFDAILAADVLEHLTRPLPLLARLTPLLRPGGTLVVSLPNIGHLTTRLGLLAGRFEYTETGILDRTHVRLYTFKTARALLAEAGFRVTGEYSGSGAFGALLNRSGPSLRPFRGLLAHGVILTAQR
jgi:methionine biosynthesis protein MetW